MHSAIRDDRIWFQNNRAAIVRFRKSFAEEFQAVANHGGDVPVFRPRFVDPTLPPWVAVVDLMRLIETREMAPDEPTARLRLKVPALRSNDRKRRAEHELKQAIAAELLANLEGDAGTVAA